jgi:hypothetical protein
MPLRSRAMSWPSAPPERILRVISSWSVAGGSGCRCCWRGSRSRPGRTAGPRSGRPGCRRRPSASWSGAASRPGSAGRSRRSSGLARSAEAAAPELRLQESVPLDPDVVLPWAPKPLRPLQVLVAVLGRVTPVSARSAVHGRALVRLLNRFNACSTAGRARSVGHSSRLCPGGTPRAGVKIGLVARRRRRCLVPVEPG